MESEPSSQSALLDAHAQEGPVCQHHWLIERPSGPTSKGVCRKCGEERDFVNYVEGGYSWGGSDLSLEQLSGSSRVPAGIDVSSAREDASMDEES